MLYGEGSYTLVVAITDVIFNLLTLDGTDDHRDLKVHCHGFQKSPYSAGCTENYLHYARTKVCVDKDLIFNYTHVVLLHIYDAFYEHSLSDTLKIKRVGTTAE